MVTGAAVPDVAERYGLPLETARDWLKDARSSPFVRDPGARAHARTELIDLVTEFVRESIQSLIAQSRVAGSDTWIERQGADDLAAYRGVELDRLYRILPAFTQPVEPERPAITDGGAVDAAARPADDGVRE